MKTLAAGRLAQQHGEEIAKMKQKFRPLAPVIVCAALALWLAACGAQEQTRSFDVGEDEANANVKRGVKPEADAQAAVIETDYGRIVVELSPNLAPRMVERFKTLASQGFYNGVTFHRINPELGIIQGGDPNSKDDDPTNDGAGSSPLPDVPAEFSDVPFDKGIVGAARQGKRPGLTARQAFDTANCQFFITLKRQPAFERPDNPYTVFGKVIQGLDNANVISTAPTADGTERPAEKIVIKSITLVPRADFK